MNDAAIERISSNVIADLERGARVPIAALVLLVRRYATTGSAAIGQALASALAATLDEPDDDRAAIAGRVVLLTEATAVSDDERLSPSIRRLAGALEAGWPDRGPFARAVASVEALLLASPFLVGTGGVAHAIDELERLVAAAYEPGEGLARTPPTQARGTTGDHVSAASTLLTAYTITGRIPYAMLAEELMRAVRPNLISRGFGLQAPDSGLRAAGSSLQPPAPDFYAACEGVRVFCRLASLHADSEYRSAAVVATDAHYAGDAEDLLRSLAPTSAHGSDAAAYAIALGEWLARTV